MELVFGRESDLNLLREWRLQPKLRQHEPARDAVAFARLATKRWRYHRQTGGIVISAVELRDAAPVRPARDSPFSSWHVSAAVRKRWESGGLKFPVFSGTRRAFPTG